MTDAAPQAIKPRRYLRVIAVLAVLFGLATVISGGTVLFGADEARMAAGRVVPFVLWFNFAAGFAYIVAGVAIWLGDRLALPLAFAIAAATALIAAAFWLWTMQGGGFEMRTVGALALRFAVWAAIALTLLRARRHP